VNEIEPGTIVAGKYRVHRLIGMGGMGFVVSATHLQLDQKLALKSCATIQWATTEVVQRFLREAAGQRAAAGRATWRVCTMWACTADGRPFIAMEYLDGDDLSRLLK